MLQEFHKARLSLIVAGFGLILRLLAVHAELWDATWLMIASRAFGTGIMFTGVSIAIVYLVEGVFAMLRVRVEVKNAAEKNKKS